jgi:hypothetical protein
LRPLPFLTRWLSERPPRPDNALPPRGGFLAAHRPVLWRPVAPRIGAAPPDTVGGHHLGQDAFAQTAVGDTQPVRRPDPADRLEDGAAGQHEVGPVGADARIGDALVERPGQEPRIHGVDFVRGHPQPVDAAAVVTRQIEVDAGQRRHRAGSAEQVESVHADAVGQPVALLEAMQQFGGVIGHVGEDLLADMAAVELFRQGDDADLQRRPGDDMVGQPARAAVLDVDQSDLGRSAADIEQHHGIGVAADQRGTAGNREPRLRLAVDDLQRQPVSSRTRARNSSPFSAERQASVAISRMRRMERALQLVAADLQRLDGAVHRRVGQPAGARQALAEAHDARKGVDDAELARPRRRGDSRRQLLVPRSSAA